MTTFYADPDGTQAPDSLTILTTKHRLRMAKHHVYQPTGGWVTRGYPGKPAYFAVEQRIVSSLDDLASVLKETSAQQAQVIIRGEPNEDALAAIAETGYTRRKKEFFDPTPRRWLCIDIDDVIAPGFDIRKQPGAVVAWLIKTHFSPEFQNTRIVWQLSSSAGLKDVETVKVHLWCWLSRPLGFQELKAWQVQGGFPADDALFRDVQIHYVADPSFEGAADPCSQRWGILEGDHNEIQVPEIDLEQARQTARTRGESFSGMVTGRDVAEILAKMGDGDGGLGFHRVILSAQMKWVRTTPPAFYARDREGLKQAIRDAARSAYLRPGRSQADVEAYLTDDALDKGIDGAIRLASKRQAEADLDFAAMPLEAAQEAIFAHARRFFEKALQA